MSFLMGSLLFGMLAASIPIIIHLLHRQRTQPVMWGAMQFLRESQLQFRRRKRVDHWLLMLMRIGLIALLAFLLARPLLIEGKYNPLGKNVGTDIAVVLDRSVSTGRTNGQATVFEQGIGVVEEVGRQMRPNDTLSVVLAEHRPNTAGLPQGVTRAGVGELVRKLKELKPGMTGASIPDAVQAARELGGRNVQKVVLVVSDEQRAGWKVENNAAWRAALGERAEGTGGDRGVRMYSVPIVPEADAATDVAVGEMKIEPGLVGLKRKAQITATVANLGGQDVGAFDVSLIVNDKEVETRPVADLKAGTSQTLRFDHEFTQAGSNSVRVRADVNDALAADNEAIGATHVWEQLRVLVIDGQLTNAGGFKSSRYLVAAMYATPEESQDPTALVQPKVVSVSGAEAEKWEDYAVIVVNDAPALEPAMLERLYNYARTGHGVWFICGKRTEQVSMGQPVANAGLFTVAVTEQKNVEKPAGIEIKAPGNPSVALLSAAERNALTGAVTKQYWSAESKDGDAQVVLAASTGEPLVIERPVGAAGGRVSVWLTSVDGDWNNWPFMMNFTPLVHETIYHLASGTTQGLRHKPLEAGMPIEWSGPPTPVVKSAKITRRADGKTFEKRPTVSNGRQRLTFHDTNEPGLYELRFDPTEVQPQPVFYGFGIDRKELDNTTLTASDVDWLTNRGYLEKKVGTDQISGALGGENKGFEMWPLLGFAVLALLVFETLMTRRMINLQKQVDVAGAGLPTPPAAAAA